jgi:hypothetical protein
MKGGAAALPVAHQQGINMEIALGIILVVVFVASVVAIVTRKRSDGPSVGKDGRYR